MRTKALILFLIIATSFSGCSLFPKKDVVEEIEKDVISIIEINQETSIFLDRLPKTKEDLYALSLEEFKNMIETCIPNYREYFKVDENRILSDEDWENFRTILSIKLFGSPMYISNELNETEIYETPTKEFLMNLSKEEFVEYLTNLQEYLHPESDKIDYSVFAAEELEAIRTSLILNAK